MSFSFQAFTKITETTGAMFQKEKKKKKISFMKKPRILVYYTFLFKSTTFKKTTHVLG